MREKRPTNTPKLTGTQKSAILVLSMNPKNSQKIFSSLNEEEIKELSQAMATLGHVDNEIIDQVTDEFKEAITSRLSLVGNIETTERFLTSILGKDRVNNILEEIRGPIGKNTWDKLASVNEDLLAAYLKNEHPQTIALVVSKIQPQTAAKILSMLPEELTHEVMMRMLSLDSVKKEILERIEHILRSDFISSISKEQKRDSHELMAEIFNNFDRTTESKYMGILEERAPEHAEKVKELMFTFDDLIRLKNPDIIALLKEIDKSKLTIALKGASEAIKNLFLDNMSQRARKILVEEMEAMGPVRLRDVDSSQSSIIVTLKSLMERGEINLTNDTEEEFIE